MFCQGNCCSAVCRMVSLFVFEGDLNIELHADLAPRASENFLVLADKGYYTGTKFHRSIKNFMIQVRTRSVACKTCHVQGCVPSSSTSNPTSSSDSTL